MIIERIYKRNDKECVRTLRRLLGLPETEEATPPPQAPPAPAPEAKTAEKGKREKRG